MHIREHIDRHDYSCPEDSVTAFYCRHCTDRFWTVDQLNAHQNARHHMQLQSAELLLCRHCGITVSSKTFLRVHTADAHASLSQIERFVFKCAVCLVAHNTLADVRAHMALVHPALVAEFCTVRKCRARLAGKLDDDHHSPAVEAKLQPLQEHIAAQHVDKLKYTCKVCEHELLSKSGALKHFVIKHS